MFLFGAERIQIIEIPIPALLSPLLASAESTPPQLTRLQQDGSLTRAGFNLKLLQINSAQFFAMILMLSSYKYSASNNRKWPFHYRYQACRRA